MSAYPSTAAQEQTLSHFGLVPIPDSCSAANAIGEREQVRRHGETERFGGLEIKHHLKLGRCVASSLTALTVLH
jgi:hypothetical protein